jgi:hypothetical protein
MVLEADDEVIGFEHCDRNLSAAAASHSQNPNRTLSPSPGAFI